MKSLTIILEGCGSECKHFTTTPTVNYYRCCKVDKIFWGGDTSNNGFPKVCTLPEVEYESNVKVVNMFDELMKLVKICEESCCEKRSCPLYDASQHECSLLRTPNHWDKNKIKIALKNVKAQMNWETFDTILGGWVAKHHRDLAKWGHGPNNWDDLSKTLYRKISVELSGSNQGSAELADKLLRISKECHSNGLKGEAIELQEIANSLARGKTSSNNICHYCIRWSNKCEKYGVVQASKSCFEGRELIPVS